MLGQRTNNNNVIAKGGCSSKTGHHFWKGRLHFYSFKFCYNQILGCFSFIYITVDIGN